MRMTHNEWPREAEQTLRAMFDAGASAALIADAVRKTRSAVCGKIKRLKLLEGATENPVSIIDAEQHHCRAVLDQRDPNGRTMFCGAHVTRLGSSWCARHERLFFTPAYFRGRS